MVKDLLLVRHIVFYHPLYRHAVLFTLGDKHIAVGSQVFSADHVLIAVGGYPSWPDIPGAELGISSDGFFELEALPKCGKDIFPKYHLKIIFFN